VRSVGALTQRSPSAFGHLCIANGTFRGHERQAYLLLLNEALGACDELDLVGRAPFFALEARGDIHRELANDEAAERDYLKALDIAKKGERDRWCEAIAWRNLGSLRAKSSDELNIRYTSDDQGIEELWRARRLFDKLGDRHFEARVVVSLAHALLSRQQIKEAQKLFVDAQTTFRSVGDLIFEARAMRGCGLTYTAQNDHRTALAAYQAAWRLSEVASDAKGAAFAAIHQTRTHRALNADNACERAFEKARRLLVRSGHTQLRLNWCKSAANFVDNPERYLKEAKALARRETRFISKRKRPPGAFSFGDLLSEGSISLSVSVMNVSVTTSISMTTCFVCSWLLSLSASSNGSTSWFESSSYAFGWWCLFESSNAH